MLLDDNFIFYRTNKRTSFIALAVVSDHEETYIDRVRHFLKRFLLKRLSIDVGNRKDKAKQCSTIYLIDPLNFLQRLN